MTEVRISSFIGALVVALLSPIDISAKADPPPAVFKDSAGNVYIHSGVRAGDRLKVELPGKAFKKNIRAGACGQISFGPTVAMPSIGNSVIVNGITIDLTTISISTPKCTNGTFSPKVNSNFKTAKGKVTLIGYTAGQSYTVFFNNLDNHFNTTVNGCAFAVIKNTVNRPLTNQIKINGTTYNISSLTSAEPPLCRKSGASVSMYTPSSW